jgi:hypothetical protein
MPRRLQVAFRWPSTFADKGYQDARGSIWTRSNGNGISRRCLGGRTTSTAPTPTFAPTGVRIAVELLEQTNAEGGVAGRAGSEMAGLPTVGVGVVAYSPSGADDAYPSTLLVVGDLFRDVVSDRNGDLDGAGGEWRVAPVGLP